MCKATKLSPLEASDREDEITDWLDDHGIDGGWELAGTFTQAGADTAWLDKVAIAVAHNTSGSAPALNRARALARRTRWRPSC